ncbi:MAG: GntR family transcriptional regulator [Verrucomicrobia bacterium]|nr:GntR family transcriptional regulator [Verrucomicrobiota bacterium]
MTSRASKEQIARHIAIDPFSTSSLYLQIREGLMQWIASQEVGFRLPSERRLAEVLEVNRTTIRQAIAPLVRDRVLVRRSKRGTVVARKQASSNDAPHPFAEMGQAQRHGGKTAVRLVLFENLPDQQRVWTQLVAAFNRSSSGVRLVIEWLPRDVDSLQKYQQYIRDQQSELVLLPYSFAMAMREQGMLLPVPKDLAESLRGDAYYSCIPGADAKGILSYVTPVHFPPWGVIWNESLAAPLTAGLGAMTQPELVRWMLRSAKRLPTGVYLNANTWDFAMTAGVPVQSPNKSAVRAFLKETFGAMAQLRPQHDRFIWSESRHGQFRELFRGGKAAFFAGSLGHVINYLNDIPFSWRGMALAPSKGRHLATSWNCVAITSECRERGAAVESLRFLASAEAQNGVATGPLNAAFLKSANRHLLAFLRAGDEGGMDAAIRRLYMHEVYPFNWGTFVSHDLRGLYREVMLGQQTAADAVLRALEMYSRRGV